MRKLIIIYLLVIMTLSGCNPFYSVEQSNVERGYRWIRRGENEKAISTFKQTIQKYPESVLAHTGLADALYEAKRDIEAIDSYNTAIDLLKKNKLASENKPSSEDEIDGKRFFSYQNQGLKFPHGLEAYLYFRRGTALKEIALRDASHSQELFSKAMKDYDHAIALAPNYEEAIAQRNILQQQSINQDNITKPNQPLKRDAAKDRHAP
jgi:tetratricopeptide (TPR) repeat protein